MENHDMNADEKCSELNITNLLGKNTEVDNEVNSENLVQINENNNNQDIIINNLNAVDKTNNELTYEIDNCLQNNKRENEDYDENEDNNNNLFKINDNPELNSISSNCNNSFKDNYLVKIENNDKNYYFKFLYSNGKS